MVDRHVPALLAATRLLREHPASRAQRVGAVGFCMGGALAGLLAASDPELAGAVIFYGMPPSDEQAARIRCPVLGCYASLDLRLLGALPAFRERMQRLGKELELHVYEGAQHAFLNDDRPSYDARASRDAWSRTLAFFARQLG